ncbi:hypothetical protein BLNAU_12148 [Blattamonas nauphoetae]|uniref:Uncharacterized protein n=1 Tax=Blattamonas nauphoetae TaxID=2049346 RepID=A0ABQ9XKL3_9EUKA|nr:hypothetical protein BLNAU_12148 [Blattamonas nauphoetae]
MMSIFRPTRWRGSQVIGRENLTRSIVCQAAGQTRASHACLHKSKLNRHSDSDSTRILSTPTIVQPAFVDEDGGRASKADRREGSLSEAITRTSPVDVGERKVDEGDGVCGCAEMVVHSSVEITVRMTIGKEIKRGHIFECLLCPFEFAIFGGASTQIWEQTGLKKRGFD